MLTLVGVRCHTPCLINASSLKSALPWATYGVKISASGIKSRWGIQRHPSQCVFSLAYLVPIAGLQKFA